ncbi:MAG TPA: trehalose-6-phosphate synthase, partial [Rhodobacteraceae bacterium]|nr:trehalose-6-phosphate synthase [Paracoccaceae bacterium]
MSEKLIVVSNRIPTGAAPSGGLVVALHDALAEHQGIWIGAHPDRDDDTGVPLIEVGTDPYTRLGFRISDEEYETYYLGFANSVLWPICHRRGDLVELSRESEEGYHAVNARLARQIADLAGPDDLIWVHDYHFFPLALELRRLGVSARIGFFLHIPFPALGDLGALSERADMPGWLAAYDLVGLQTRADVARCLELFRATEGAEMLLNGKIKLRERTVAVRSFPIGIDVEGFAAAAREPLAPGTLGADMAGDILIGGGR